MDDRGEGKTPHPANVASDLAVAHPYQWETRVMSLADRHDLAPHLIPRDYEGLAFTFCKAATIILLTQKFALPVASGAAALFFILADRHGKKDTRCIVRVPLLIAGFWSIVSLLSKYTIVRPLLGR